MRIIETCIKAIYFRSITKEIGCSPFSILKYVPPLEPASHLNILCKYSIQVYSIKDLLVQGGEHTLNLKMVMPLFNLKLICLLKCFYDAHAQYDKN